MKSSVDARDRYFESEFFSSLEGRVFTSAVPLRPKLNLVWMSETLRLNDTHLNVIPVK